MGLSGRPQDKKDKQAAMQGPAMHGHAQIQHTDPAHGVPPPQYGCCAEDFWGKMKCIPFLVIVNFLLALGLIIAAMIMEPDIEMAAKQFGYATGSWRTIMTWGLVFILTIDAGILTFAIAATNYCLNHGCGVCLLQEKRDNYHREVGGCDGGNALACCCGDVMQWILFILSYILAIFFAVGIWAITVGMTLVALAYGACWPYFDSENLDDGGCYTPAEDAWPAWAAESAKSGDDICVGTKGLIHTFVKILGNTLEIMPGSFFNEDDLDNFTKDQSEHCDAIKGAKIAATRIYIILILLTVVQWNLALSARSNITRVDGHEKAKQKGEDDEAHEHVNNGGIIHGTTRGGQVTNGGPPAHGHPHALQLAHPLHARHQSTPMPGVYGGHPQHTVHGQPVYGHAATYGQ